MPNNANPGQDPYPNPLQASNHLIPGKVDKSIQRQYNVSTTGENARDLREIPKTIADQTVKGVAGHSDPYGLTSAGLPLVAGAITGRALNQWAGGERKAQQQGWDNNAAHQQTDPYNKQYNPYNYPTNPNKWAADNNEDRKFEKVGTHTYQDQRTGQEYNPDSFSADQRPGFDTGSEYVTLHQVRAPATSARGQQAEPLELHTSLNKEMNYWADGKCVGPIEKGCVKDRDVVFLPGSKDHTAYIHKDDEGRQFFNWPGDENHKRYYLYDKSYTV